MCCDLIVAEAGQFVALPEIKLGVFPGTGGTVRAMRRIGEARAKEMMFFGEKLPVETALDWGLLNRVVPKGQALATAMGMAKTLTQRPSVALQLLKQSAEMAFDMSERTAVRASLSLSDKAFSSADCDEGVKAFFAKRAPVFRHE
jgi:enoyl-CoA hydratase/carnithine racemase